MKWYLEVLQKYAVLSGRARWKRDRLFILFNMLITIALASIDSAMGSRRAAAAQLQSLYVLAVWFPASRWQFGGSTTLVTAGGGC